MSILGNGISFIYFVDCPYFIMDSIFFFFFWSINLKKQYPTDSIIFLLNYPFFKYFHFIFFFQEF